MAHQLVTGADLYKGFKLKNVEGTLGANIYDILPFQMLSLEEKTDDWKRMVADYFEVIGWGNVQKRAPRIQRNYWMRYGKLNPSDYIVNPKVNPFSEAIGMILPENSQSPLEQFYPIAPNLVDILRGEFIKRDTRWTIETVDPYSKSEAFTEKKEAFEQVLYQSFQMEKQATLAQMGLSEEINPEEYHAQLDQMMKQFTEVEQKSRNFRTTGAKWAEKVLKIHEKRYNLQELEPDGLESGLITDSEYWHLDMQDEDFRVELINPMFVDYHKGINTKYVSEGDYFVWFDFLSAGDIVNKLGRRLKEDDIEKLKKIYMQTQHLLIPDYLKDRQGAYYDFRKPYKEATDLNPAMNDALLGKELAYTYTQNPNFQHNMNVDLFSPVVQNKISGVPQMFRVMRLYWRSMRKIGWLTKINRDGSMDKPTWIDENYKVTIEPVYDTSVKKEKTKNNLLYGEHIDWEWAPEWRHIIKITPNQKHTFWLNSNNTFDCIYIDGDPVPFQFRGTSNPFESYPPVEGCTYSYINTTSHSFIDRIRPFQILYNISMNKVPKKILKDFGNKLVIDRRMMQSPNASNSTTTTNPVGQYEERLRNSDIVEYTLDRESLITGGNPPMPSVLQLSTAQEADLYLGLSQKIKWEAGEIVGITRQRTGAQKASETAYSVEQGIQYSETQTEKYFEQHGNLMQRFRQRMLDATQYFTTFKESNRDIYMNDRDQTVMLEIEGMENLLRHYNIYLQSNANTRAALQKISAFLEGDNTLPITPSAKIESLIEGSVPRILEVIKTAENEQIQRELQQQEAENRIKEQELAQRREEAAQKLAHDDYQKQLDRDTQIDIATIRALGGVQTDSNADGSLDAKANLDAYFKNQQILDARKNAQDNINAKRQTEMDKLAVEREKNATELEKEKIKQKGALAVAKENKNASELKNKRK